MKDFKALPVIEREPVDLNALPDNMSLEDAQQLIGFPTTDGRKILGVTGKPGLGHTEGIYLSVTSPGTKAVHIRVGDEG